MTTQEKVTNNEVNNQEIVTKKETEGNNTSNKEATTRNSKTSISSQSVYYNTTVDLVATVLDAKTNSIATDGKVVFKLNGKTIGISQVKSGKATLKYNTATLSPKTYNITEKYG